MTATEEADIRRHCGYAGGDGQYDQLLAWRMGQLTPAESAVARTYCATINACDPHLAADWRHRLCGFLGVPPGPLLSF